MTDPLKPAAGGRCPHPRAILVRVLLAALFTTPWGALAAQETPVWELPPREQLAAGYVDAAWMEEVLPGFADVAWAGPCLLEVYLVDPAWGDSARALLRPLVAGPRREGSACRSEPELAIRRSRYSLSDLLALSWRMESLLNAPGSSLRTTPGASRGGIAIEVRSRAVRDAAAARLEAARDIPLDLVEWVVQAEEPFFLPDAAYVAVLDALARRFPGARERPISLASLPLSLTDEDLASLGFMGLDPAEERPDLTTTAFLNPRDLGGGRFLVRVSACFNAERPGTLHEIRVYCTGERCRVEAVEPVHPEAGNLVVTTDCDPVTRR